MTQNKQKATDKKWIPSLQSFGPAFNKRNLLATAPFFKPRPGLPPWRLPAGVARHRTCQERRRKGDERKVEDEAHLVSAAWAGNLLNQRPIPPPTPPSVVLQRLWQIRFRIGGWNSRRRGSRLIAAGDDRDGRRGWGRGDGRGGGRGGGRGDGRGDSRIGGDDLRFVTSTVTFGKDSGGSSDDGVGDQSCETFGTKTTTLSGGSGRSVGEVSREQPKNERAGGAGDSGGGAGGNVIGDRSGGDNGDLRDSVVEREGRYGDGKVSGSVRGSGGSGGRGGGDAGSAGGVGLEDFQDFFAGADFGDLIDEGEGGDDKGEEKSEGSRSLGTGLGSGSDSRSSDGRDSRSKVNVSVESGSGGSGRSGSEGEKGSEGDDERKSIAGGRDEEEGKEDDRDDDSAKKGIRWQRKPWRSQTGAIRTPVEWDVTKFVGGGEIVDALETPKTTFAYDVFERSRKSSTEQERAFKLADQLRRRSQAGASPKLRSIPAESTPKSTTPRQSVATPGQSVTVRKSMAPGEEMSTRRYIETRQSMATRKSMASGKSMLSGKSMASTSPEDVDSIRRRSTYLKRTAPPKPRKIPARLSTGSVESYIMKSHNPPAPGESDLEQGWRNVPINAASSTTTRQDYEISYRRYLTGVASSATIVADAAQWRSAAWGRRWVIETGTAEVRSSFVRSYQRYLRDAKQEGYAKEAKARLTAYKSQSRINLAEGVKSVV